MAELVLDVCTPDIGLCKTSPQADLAGICLIVQQQRQTVLDLGLVRLPILICFELPSYFPLRMPIADRCLSLIISPALSVLTEL